MREIKIDFIHNNAGRNYTGDMSDYVHFTGGKLYSHVGIVRLFTGLKDKNGKEIYEGDVLRMFMSGKSIGADERVEFKEGSYWLRYRHMPLRNWICEPEFDGECEVIGNIYESNPLQVE